MTYTTSEALEDEPPWIQSLIASQRRKYGCRRVLAAGQWWGTCGETDMGASVPALCTECGGQYLLKEAISQTLSRTYIP